MLKAGRLPTKSVQPRSATSRVLPKLSTAMMKKLDRDYGDKVAFKHTPERGSGTIVLRYDSDSECQRLIAKLTVDKKK